MTKCFFIVLHFFVVLLCGKRCRWAVEMVNWIMKEINEIVNDAINDAISNYAGAIMREDGSAVAEGKRELTDLQECLRAQVSRLDCVIGADKVEQFSHLFERKEQEVVDVFI